LPQSYPDVSRHLNLQKRGEDERDIIEFGGRGGERNG